MVWKARQKFELKTKKLKLVNWPTKNGINSNEKKKDPIDPDIVLFGLIFVNFLPLKNLPNKSPPMSELIDTNKE